MSANPSGADGRISKHGELPARAISEDLCSGAL